MNEYIFKGSNSTIFIFASLLNVGQLLNKRIFSSRSKNFPIKSTFFIERDTLSGKAIRKSMKLPLFEKQRWKNKQLCRHTLSSPVTKIIMIVTSLVCFASTSDLIVVVVVVALLFYVHGKHLRSCRDGQLT